MEVVILAGRCSNHIDESGSRFEPMATIDGCSLF